MNIAQQLYQLQALDLEQDKLRLRIKEIRGQLGETEELRAARAELERIQAKLSDWHTRRRDLALETQSLETKLASAEERMYSGKVTNPKELADLQKESVALRKYRGKLDEKSLEAMMAIEENETALNQIQAKLADIEANWTAQQHALMQEQEETKIKLANLEKTRPQHTHDIPANDMQQYESLRQRKNGLAIASLEEGFCSLCGVGISEHKLAQVTLGESLIFCSNCERILIE